MDYDIFDLHIIDLDSHTATISLFVSDKCDYFCGHFPDFKLLPAVAQLDIVLYYANKIFSCGKCVKSIKRIKFSRAILPNTTIMIKYNYNERALTFRIEDEAQKLKATGSLELTFLEKK